MRSTQASSPGRTQRPARSLPARTPSTISAPPARPQTPYEREQSTKRRGEISELAFALAAARHGFGIARPYGDSERYDLILDCPKKDPAHVHPAAESSTNLSSRPQRSDSERSGKTCFSPPPPSPRPRLIRVQVKATTQLQSGLYRVNAHRRIYGTAVPYTLDEIDFFAAYVIPDDSWFIFPLPHILGSTALTLNPKRRRKRHINDPYREAWHLLTQPDGLEFA